MDSIFLDVYSHICMGRALNYQLSLWSRETILKLILRRGLQFQSRGLLYKDGNYLGLTFGWAEL